MFDPELTLDGVEGELIFPALFERQVDFDLSLSFVGLANPDLLSNVASLANPDLSSNFAGLANFNLSSKDASLIEL